MEKERRYFLKTKGPLGPVYAIAFGYPDYQYSMFKSREKEILMKVEIPKRFWHYSLDEMINFFENVYDPKRMKIKE